MNSLVAIVNETVEELHKHSTNVASTYSPITSTESGIYSQKTSRLIVTSSFVYLKTEIS